MLCVLLSCPSPYTFSKSRCLRMAQPGSGVCRWGMASRGRVGFRAARGKRQNTNLQRFGLTVYPAPSANRGFCAAKRIHLFIFSSGLSIHPRAASRRHTAPVARSVIYCAQFIARLSAHSLRPILRPCGHDNSHAIACKHPVTQTQSATKYIPVLSHSMHAAWRFRVRSTSICARMDRYS